MKPKKNLKGYFFLLLRQLLQMTPPRYLKSIFKLQLIIFQLIEEFSKMKLFGEYFCTKV